jgi:hypothetical protein
MRKILLGLGLAVALVAAALAQTIGIPQATSIGSSDLFQDVVGGVPSAQNYYVSSALLGNYGPTLPGNNADNFLIGGDAATNLWQRGTTGASVTTTTTYGGPDRWAYWSGTNTAVTVSKDVTAANLPTGVSAGFKMQRTAAQTGVVETCMAQEIESAAAYALAGQTVEIDLYAAPLTNFSAANAAFKVYLITGTGSDEGVAKMAYTVNAGGGGGSAWTGGVATGVTVTTTGIGSVNRYSVAIPAPSTTTEAGVAICYTPVGTASTTDAITFSAIQLTRNSALTTVAGTSGAALNTNDARAKAFNRRPVALEAALQYRYTQVWTEATIYAAAGSQASPLGPCAAVDTTHTNCWLQFAAPMRTAPTMTYTAGFASPTSTTQATLGACSALATAQTVSGAIMTNYGALVNCTATTIPAAGVASFFYASSGTGKITANAEL